jgi:hypothetical protein
VAIFRKENKRLKKFKTIGSEILNEVAILVRDKRIK